VTDLLSSDTLIIVVAANIYAAIFAFRVSAHLRAVAAIAAITGRGVIRIAEALNGLEHLLLFVTAFLAAGTSGAIYPKDRRLPLNISAESPSPRRAKGRAYAA
jgi:hypothetical protein